MDRVLSDRDAVAVIELLLLDRLAVDERAVGAPEVDDPEPLSTPLDAGVVAARRGVAKDEVVVGRSSKAERAVTGSVRVTCVRS